MSALGVPRAQPLASWVGLLLSLGFIGVAVVAVHDLLTSQGWTDGNPWLTTASSHLDGTQASALSTAIGVIIALVGLGLVLVALLPSRRTHLQAPHGDLWLTPAALRSLTVDAAVRTPLVRSATATVRAKRISVAADADPSSTEAVQTAVHTVLDGLSDRPVNVTAKEVRDDSPSRRR